MARSYAKSKGRGSKGPTFVQLFHHVMDSPNYRHMSYRARALLLDVLRFYNRRNNGDLAITPKLMRPLGWTSNDQLQKAQMELEHYGFIKRSRQGGRNSCNLFALTFYPIDECGGKHDLAPSSVPSNEWKNEQPTPPNFSKSLPRDTGQPIPHRGAVRTTNVVKLPRQTGQSGQKSQLSYPARRGPSKTLP